MLQKIIQLQNIKQWQHNASGDQQFSHLNLIYGRNGSGKSTLCDVFDLINQRDKEGIEALKPIELDGKPSIKILVDSKNITLTDLDAPFTFRIFNQKFIDNNLYIANSKDRQQLSNYYEFSLGNVSVEKEQEIEILKTQNDAITSQIAPIEVVLLAKFNSKAISKIKAIKDIANADEKLEKLNAQQQDVQSIEHFRKRSKLSELKFDLPVLDQNIFAINIDELSKDATDKVNKHIEDNFKQNNKRWIESGISLVTESNNCPFCAQSLSSSPIFHLYQEFINDAYVKARNEFRSSSDNFIRRVTNISQKLDELAALVQSNQSVIKSWDDKITSISLDFNFAELKELSSALLEESNLLIAKKNSDLLSVVELTKFKQIFGQISEKLNFHDYNAQLITFNNDISSFMNGLTKDNSHEIQLEIDEIKESKLRFTPDIIAKLDEYSGLDDIKKANTKRIKELRDQIDSEQETSIQKHKDSINEILKSFNSMIRIKELKKDNKGGKGSSRLQYVVDFINSEFSTTSEQEHKRVFERVLSLGDRSALALAFFLSRFSKNNEDQSIIVLDDPMSSLDKHRRDATIRQIAGLVLNGYQTFVLSHDPFFLSEVHKYFIPGKNTKCFKIDLSYKDLEPLKANSARYGSSQINSIGDYESYVMHSYLKEYNKLYEFVATGKETEKVAIARSIRPILEAHLRFLYPKEFGKGLWLGDMIKRIREETDEASLFYDKHNKFNTIEKINEFSKQYHHAEDFNTKIQELDMNTVQSYAKETLCFITGL